MSKEVDLNETSEEVDLNEEEFTVNYPGSAALDDTCRAIKRKQKAQAANLTKLEPVVNERSNGTKVNLNIATYQRVDSVLDVLDDVLCIDVSTVAGANAAAQANHTHKPIAGSPLRIFVKDKLTEVQIFGKTS